MNPDIPVPNIEIPHFQHGQKNSGGAGQGEGEVGQPIGRGLWLVHQLCDLVQLRTSATGTVVRMSVDIAA